MGQSSTKPLAANQSFKLKTSANLVSETNITSKERKMAIDYLKSPAFKKRALFDLNSNFEEDNLIKITIESIIVSPDLKVVINGHIKKTSKKANDELMEDDVKDILVDVLPKYSAEGERMPKKNSTFRIQFASSATLISLA